MKGVICTRTNERNPEGYADPTAQSAVDHIRRMDSAEDRRVREFIAAIRTLAVQCGYTIVGHLDIIDRRTGRRYS